MMKKLAVILITVLLCVCAIFGVACGNNPTSDSTGGENNQVSISTFIGTYKFKEMICTAKRQGAIISRISFDLSNPDYTEDFIVATVNSGGTITVYQEMIEVHHGTWERYGTNEIKGELENNGFPGEMTFVSNGTELTINWTYTEYDGLVYIYEYILQK